MPFEMVDILGLVAIGVAAFAATNIDDIFYNLSAIAYHHWIICAMFWMNLFFLLAIFACKNSLSLSESESIATNEIKVGGL